MSKWEICDIALDTNTEEKDSLLVTRQQVDFDYDIGSRSESIHFVRQELCLQIDLCPQGDGILRKQLSESERPSRKDIINDNSRICASACPTFAIVWDGITHRDDIRMEDRFLCGNPWSTSLSGWIVDIMIEMTKHGIVHVPCIFEDDIRLGNSLSRMVLTHLDQVMKYASSDVPQSINISYHSRHTIFDVTRNDLNVSYHPIQRM
jgi:hypothetical protein